MDKKSPKKTPKPPKKQKKHHGNYKFTIKRHTEKGIVSTVFSLLSLVGLVATSAVSYRMKGNAGIYIGTIGLSAMVFAGIGLIMGLLSFRERERYYLFSRVGSLLSFFTLLLWVFIYVLGSFSYS